MTSNPDAAGLRPRPTSPVIYSVTVTGIAVNTLVAPAIPDIVAGLGAGPGAAGWVIGAATFPGILLSPLIGALADRYGRRNVLVPCLALYAVAGGLCMFATSIEMLTLLRLVQGIGSAALVNLAVVLIGDHWTGTDRAAMVGRNAAVLTVCLTIFPLVGGVLADVGGWQAVFAPFFLGLVTAAIVHRRLPPDRPSESVSVVTQLRRVVPTVRSGWLWPLLVGGFLTFVLIFGLLLTVLPLYLEETFGLGGTGRGLVLGIPAIATTATALSVGRLRTRWSYRALLVVGSMLFVVGLATVSVAQAVWVIVAGVAVYGLGEGLVVPTLQERATSAGGPETRATVLAVFVSATRLGQTVGPLLAAGLAAGALGPTGTFLAGAFLAVSIGLIFALRRDQPGD